MSTSSLFEAFQIARAHTAVTELPWSGVVLPPEPKIDEVTAFAEMQMYCHEEVAFVQFHDRAVCTAVEIKEWLGRGVFPISVGERDHLKNRKYNSATEWVSVHCGLPLSRGLNEVVRLMNDNLKFGTVRNSPMSIAALMRKMYKLDSCPSWHSRIVHAAAHVATCFIKVYSSGDAIVRPLTVSMEQPIAELAKKFAISKGLPFTLGRYVSDMWALGFSPEEICEKVGFWQDGMKRLDRERERVSVEFKTMRHDSFTLPEARGLVLKSGDSFLIDKAIGSELYVVKVIISPNGHVTIFTKLTVTGLAEHLKRLEPGMWHHHVPTNVIMNGGPQHLSIPPTRIPVGKLIGMIQERLRPQLLAKMQKVA